MRRLALGHDCIGTEHVLLGLVRATDGVAARILLDFGVGADTIRNEVIRMMSGPGRHVSRAEPSPARIAVRSGAPSLPSVRRSSWDW